MLLAGLGAAGALAVNTVAGLVAVALCAWGLRDFWTREISDDPVLLDRREVTVLLVGSLAFASLTNVDILLSPAAYYFPGDVAGVYAAAALVGKAVLFLPAAVVTVLLPKAASRIAAGLTAQKILLASAAATFLIGISATVVLALVPEQLLVWAFGGDFRDAKMDLLGWFGLAMTAAALVNVYLSVYFAERDARFPLLVLAAAIVQVVVVVAWHPDPESIVLVTLMCASGILLLHEIAFPHALVRAWRARQLRAAPSG